MKKLYFLAFLLFSLYAKTFSQGAFTSGNLVVFKVGNGTDTLSTAGFAVNIDEYSTAGSFVKSHPLPTSISGANKRIIGSGSATSDGQITRSVDKKFLVVAGYDTIPDPNRAFITNSTSINVNRVVGIFSADGSLDATTALSDAYNANLFRAAVSNNGTDIWLAGTGISPSAGVRYTTKGATTTTQLSTSVTNIRMVNIFNNQLYCTTGSGAFKAISAVGTNLPTTAGETITVLPGFPNTTASGPDPYAFSIKPGTANIAYVADARSKANGGGVQRWEFDGNNWNLKYTLDSGLTTGLRNLVVNWDTPTPTIYAITGDSYVKNMPGNKIVSLVDTDSTTQFSIIATADANFMFRGIAFAPEPAISLTTYTFTGNGNWDVAANWLNNIIPPSALPASSAIIIDNIIGGQCILNVSQTISAGASLTVMTGKNLVVPGILTIQ